MLATLAEEEGTEAGQEVGEVEAGAVVTTEV